MKQKKWMFALAIICQNICVAQTKEVLDIAAQYPGENAVLRSSTHHLVLKFEDKQLNATSTISQEILLLSDLAPGIYNSANVYHSSFHKLGEVEAFSRVPNKGDYKTIKGTWLKTTSSPTENIFFDDTKVSVFGFSGLTKYSSTFLQYEETHSELAFLPVYYFQSYLPGVEHVFKITAPKSVHIKALIKDIDPSLVTSTVEEKKGNVIYTWTTKNTKRYKDYNNSPSSPAGLGRIIPYVTDYTLPGDSKPTTLIADKDGLYKFMYHFIENVNKEEGQLLKKKAQELTADCKNDSCKAEKIYKWLQENIKYVAFEDSLGGFVPREAESVYEKKFGDCKDMTSLLVAMYRSVGLKAYFSWIGTREKPYTFSDIPLPLLFNHVICAWQNNNGQWVFIDGTHSSISFGVPPYGIQGKETLIAKSATDYEIIKVPEIDAPYNKTEDTTWLSIADQNELQGKVSIKYSGYPSWSMQSAMRTNNESDAEKIIKSVSSRGSNKYFQKSGRYEIKDDRISFYSDFSVKDYVQKSGDEIFINLNLVRYNSDQKVDDISVRKLPIENKYKTVVREVLILDIPKGYAVEYLPPNAAHNQDGLWGYKMSYKTEGNKIVFTKEFTEYSLYIMPSLFEKHNQLIDEINKQYKESIILKAETKAAK